MLEGNELRIPEEFVWPSVPTRIASLRVQSGPQNLAEASLSRYPHYGGVKNTFFGKCEVVMPQKLSYGTKTLYAKFELDLCGVRIRAKSLKF